MNVNTCLLVKSGLLSEFTFVFVWSRKQRLSKPRPFDQTIVSFLILHVLLTQIIDLESQTKFQNLNIQYFFSNLTQGDVKATKLDDNFRISLSKFKQKYWIQSSFIVSQSPMNAKSTVFLVFMVCIRYKTVSLLIAIFKDIIHWLKVLHFIQCT